MMAFANREISWDTARLCKPEIGSCNDRKPVQDFKQCMEAKQWSWAMSLPEAFKTN